MEANGTSWVLDFSDADDKSARRKIRKKPSKSLVEVLKQKYCSTGDNVQTRHVKILFHGRPKSSDGAELGYLRNVCLSESNISTSGLHCHSLKSLCPNVVDLDISGNKFESWEEILPAIAQLRSLKFVNIARNKVKNDQYLQRWEEGLPDVENLVLNETNIPWSDVLCLTTMLHQLKELHVCGNSYSTLPCTGHRGLDSLECLRMNNNNLDSWCEVWKLQHLTKLKTLILSGNPLVDVFFHDNRVTCTCQCSCHHDNDSYQSRNEELAENNNVDSFASIVEPSDSDIGKPVEQGADSNKPVEQGADSNKPIEQGADSNKPVEQGADSNKPVKQGADICSDNTVVSQLDNRTMSVDTVDFNGNVSEEEEAIEQWCKEIINNVIRDMGKGSSYTGEMQYSVCSDDNTSTIINEREVNSSDVEVDNSTGTSSIEESSKMSPECSCIKNGWKPFQSLETLCMSETRVGKWKHLSALRSFPALKSVRMKGVKLGSKLSDEDRRKLFMASLPNIQWLNGSEVTSTERDKAERHLVRHFSDKKLKPDIFHDLEKKHGTVEPLVDIDITRGYQEWLTLTFIYRGDVVFVETVRGREPVGKLRIIIAEKLSLYASFKNIEMYHKYVSPHHQNPDAQLGDIEQLVLDTLPISRFDILDGDEIHVDVHDNWNSGMLKYVYIENYMPKYHRLQQRTESQ